MNQNIKYLIKACEALNVEYKVHHSTKNLVEVILNEKSFLFVNWTTPLNIHSITKLNEDKDYFYNFFKDTIKMPKTKSYLNPHCDERYINYLDNKSIFEIVNDIEDNFNYPMIIKKNRGSWGTNVFKVNQKNTLEKALINIFNENSLTYDYVALAQEYIDIKIEFRAIFYKHKLQFCYEKDISEAIFTGNLSPFHYENSKAKLVTDEKLLEKMEVFCKPIFEKLNINYTGIDLAIDKNGLLWLIEANSSPGFDNIINSGESEVVFTLYKKILQDLKYEFI